MVKMKLSASILVAFAATSTVALADHSLKKMMLKMNAFSQLGDTKKLGPFSINVATFGSKPSRELTSIR